MHLGPPERGFRDRSTRFISGFYVAALDDADFDGEGGDRFAMPPYPLCKDFKSSASRVDGSLDARRMEPFVSVC